MSYCKSFAFVAEPDAEILILGSLPGIESLKQQQYYAYERNVFWKIMGDMFGANPQMAYDKRLRQLTKHKIALWDVCESAHRIGSLDSAIQMETMKPNNFNAFFKAHTHIRLICFNGKPAEKLFHKEVLKKGLRKAYASITRVILPSTSPANATIRYDQKLTAWKKHIIL